MTTTAPAPGNGGKRKTSLWRRIKQRYWLFRDRLYRWKYMGIGDTLCNGQAYRYALPRAEQDKQCRNLVISFDDPRVSGHVGGAHLIVKMDKEYMYLRELQYHAEKLKRFGMISAEPEDKKGFYVKWG